MKTTTKERQPTLKGITRSDSRLGRAALPGSSCLAGSSLAAHPSGCRACRGCWGCSCHVWAIDGYIDDASANVVNQAYDAAGNNNLLNGRPPGVGTLDQLVAYLVVQCRRTPLRAAIPCVVFGGFQNAADGAPEHMWLQSGNFIYDTMPGAPLRRKMIAGAPTLLHPPSEHAAFPAARVGSTPTSLTTSQFNMITSAVWVNNEYSPPDGLLTRAWGALFG